MKLFLAYVLLLLCSTVSAAEPVTPDEYFERAQETSEQMRQIFEEMLKREADGTLDPKTAPEFSEKAEVMMSGFRHDLEKASQGGHTVATYVLANMDSKFGPSAEERKQFCEPLQKAMDEGLLAAAVSYFHQCDVAYMRFDLKSPGHVNYIGKLQDSLQQEDKHQANYPMATKRSLCFENQRDELKTKKVFAYLQARSQSLFLTYDQYRAEAYYILAGTRFNDKGQPDKLNLDYLNQALALGCTDAMRLKDFYEKEFGGTTAK